MVQVRWGCKNTLIRVGRLWLGRIARGTTDIAISRSLPPTSNQFGLYSGRSVIVARKKKMLQILKVMGVVPYTENSMFYRNKIQKNNYVHNPRGVRRVSVSNL